MATKKVVDLQGSKNKDKTILKKQSEVIKEKNEKVLAKKEEVINKSEEVKQVVSKKSEVKLETKPQVKYELSISVQDLFNAGCHLGHKIAKTNPKIGEFLYGKKDGVAVVDLPKSYLALEKACAFLHNLKKEGKTVLLVGTKRSAREVVRRVATETGMPYVSNRWLGGIISNWDQIRKSIRNMNSLESKLEKGSEKMSKKDLSLARKELTRMQTNMGGLKSLEKIFDAMLVVDIAWEKTALKEAKNAGIPVVGIVDTDSNPYSIDYPVVVNDDSVKSVTLLVEEMGRALKS